MPRLCINASWLDLDLSMYPSFLSSIYVYREEQYWVKMLGAGRGTRVYKNGVLLCCDGPACGHEMLEGLSGAWCLEECRSGVNRAGFVNPYPGLVVSAAMEPLDRLLVASAAVLSRHTRYATNVRRWMYEIFADMVDTGEDSIEAAIRRAAGLPSPQPRHLSRVLRQLAGIVLEAGDPWSTRRRLLGLHGIGPKTSDAILLFTGLTTWVAPGDVHLERFVAQVLGVHNVAKPAKNRCLENASCTRCMWRSRCLSGLVVSRFQGAAGLVQTIAYVYGRLGLDNWRTRLYRELKRYYRGFGEASSLAEL